MTIVAKFVCIENARKLYNGHKLSSRVELAPVMGTVGDDSIFGTASPSGKFACELLNKHTAMAFEPGAKYYFFLIAADDTRQSPWVGDSRMDGSSAYRFGTWRVQGRTTREYDHSRQWDISLAPLKESVKTAFDTDYPGTQFNLTINNAEAARELQQGREYTLVFVRSVELLPQAA